MRNKCIRLFGCNIKVLYDLIPSFESASYLLSKLVQQISPFFLLYFAGLLSSYRSFPSFYAWPNRHKKWDAFDIKKYELDRIFLLFV